MISFGFTFFLGKIFKNKSLFGKIIFELLSIFFTIALIYYAGQSFAFKGNDNSLGESSLFVFLIVGEISLVMPMSFAERIISYFQEIRSQQFYQTLLGLHISPTQFILSRAMVDVIFPFFRIVTIIVFCALFLNFNITFLSFLAFCGLQFLAICLFIFMALITNLIYLKFNRGIGLFYSAQSFAAILGGLYFPIKIFPGYIKNMSVVLPQTQILKASRQIFHSPIIEVSPYLILLTWLGLFFLLYLSLNKYLVNSLKKKARFF